MKQPLQSGDCFRFSSSERKKENHSCTVGFFSARSATIKKNVRLHVSDNVQPFCLLVIVSGY